MFLKYFTIVILLVITLPNLMGQEIDLRDLPEVEDYMVVLTNPNIPPLQLHPMNVQ